MKKFIFILFLSLFLFIPFNCVAISDSYEDYLNDIVGVEVEEDKVNIYLFYGDGCPHCADEKEVLDDLEKKYEGQINIYKFETWENKENKKLMLEAKEIMGVDKNEAVPFTVIGKEAYVGYSDYVGKSIEKQIRINLGLDEISDSDTVVEQNKVDIPFIGNVDAGKVSVGITAIILGFVDGFNPCAMWILLFIINMLFGMKDRKKMFLLGFIFLFTSAIFYFLSMLGINIILGFITTNELRSLIGLVAIVLGVYNLYVYFRDRKLEDGCHVVDEKKRKNIKERINKIKNARNLFLAIGGIILLAISVNMVELACSAGFPMIFNEVLVANEVTGGLRIIYLLIYVLFYMIDDMVIFTISMCTLTITGLTTKYNKIVKIVGGVLMILMGLLLIFKPAWIMLNF